MTDERAPQPYDPGSRGARVLRDLGMDALVEIIETIGYGVCVTGDEHTWTYLNPAGERIIGASLEELEGRDYLLSFAEHERVALLALEHKQREGDTGFYTNTVVRDDGTQALMTWSGTVVEVDGQELAPAIFHEVTDLRRAQREVAELGAPAVRLARGGSTHDVLQALVEEAVAATRALAAQILLADADGHLRVGASTGFPPELPEVIRRSAVRLEQLPAGALLLHGRGGFLHDDRSRLSANEATRPWVEATAGMPWQGATKIPLRRGDRAVGVLVVVLPDRITAPSESETALWESLVEQGELALSTDQLRSEVSYASATLERERIARELHDSVNHALFAVQLRAQAVELALSRDQPDVARDAAAGLADLARQATREMRELLTEARQRAGARVTRLDAAVRDLADTVSRRDGLLIALALPEADLAELPAATVEHVVRIAGEALHNTVKHAAARTATLSVTVEGTDLVVSVTDDGRGFDTALTGSVGQGQRTMRERAELVGGSLSVVSRPGEGTTVVARVPLPA
ncbi:PAS domain-containing sensor histidine kinase [Ornithinimicrobium pekingense]|uniref:Oxygen sensor histidine kinase NreB n=1 Tax=Ornithinimicrobium pekingense TaxID=384677 RepID=A0ABQ2FAN2_9MICO|nr:PAS domain-containing sensor histidine kinase [Ornithinimicrobium pekingense]GGK78142.1 hypothetical protein GCM10011509_28350 [Ornithinimicrobium pekingense]